MSINWRGGWARLWCGEICLSTRSLRLMWLDTWAPVLICFPTTPGASLFCFLLTSLIGSPLLLSFAVVFQCETVFPPLLARVLGEKFDTEKILSACDCNLCVFDIEKRPLSNAVVYECDGVSERVTVSLVEVERVCWRVVFLVFLVGIVDNSVVICLLLRAFRSCSAARRFFLLIWTWGRQFQYWLSTGSSFCPLW